MQIEKRKEKQKPTSNGWHASFWYVAFVVVYKVLTTITFRKIGLTNVLPSITIYIWRAMLSYCLIQLHIIHNSNKSITNFKKTACDNPSWGGVAVLCTTCVHLFFGCFFLICLLNIPSVHSQCHASCSISMPGVVHGCVPKSKVHGCVPKSIRASFT